MQKGRKKTAPSVGAALPIFAAKFFPLTTAPSDSLSSGPRARNRVFFFLLFWVVLNLLQAGLTELTSDEGYYWFYARHLQWGYYDHPPLVALLIKAGTVLLPGELGVRALNAVLSTAALYLFFTLLPDAWRQSRKTYLVLLSAPLLHYLAFLVFPDGPLLFSSLLFLVLYKRFLARPTVATALLLGLSLALMAYAKYHGALVLLFTVGANRRLLKSGRFYLALAVAALLFAPHLWWQYAQGFPTFKYHLSGRTDAWSFRYVGEYLSQQVVAIGPGLFFVAFVAKAGDVFERTLKAIVIGTFVFFLVSSFKTFVHFHWTSIAVYPLLYFAVRYYNDPGKRKLFNALVVPFVVLFFAVRLLLLLPLVPALHAGEDYYRGRKAWAGEVSALAGNRPLFIPNNLRDASLYSFYSGKAGVTLYNRPGKKSQYELWGFEDSLQGREVLYLSKDPYPGSTRFSTSLNRDFYFSVVPSFQSYFNGLGMNARIEKATPDSVVAVVTLTNETGGPVLFEKRPGNNHTGLVYSLEQGGNVRKADAARELTAADNLPAGGSLAKRVVVPVSDVPPGDYEILFGVRSGPLPDAILTGAVRFVKR